MDQSHKAIFVLAINVSRRVYNRDKLKGKETDRADKRIKSGNFLNSLPPPGGEMKKFFLCFGVVLAADSKDFWEKFPSESV